MAALNLHDVIDAAAAIRPDSALHALRRRRDKVTDATQGCYDELFGAPQDAGLRLTERLVVALDMCRAAGVQALATHYRDALAAAGAGADEQAIAAEGTAVPRDPRLAEIMAFARAVGAEPHTTDRAALDRLQAVGLAPEDIVTLGQLVGFVSYQLRLVAGLAALGGLVDDNANDGAASAGAAAQASAAPFVHPANLPPPGEPLRLNGYTSETLGWTSWLPVVDPEVATPEQLAVLDASHPKAKTQDFYMVLVHQPGILNVRSAAFNAIMYAPGGLPRHEREVVTTVVSRINRCVYCASVHAQRYEQLAKRNEIIAQLFADPLTAGTDERERALVAAAAALTQSPGTFGGDTLLRLRAAGLSDLELLDVVHAAALFAWANRLMLNLGEAVYPTASSAA